MFALGRLLLGATKNCLEKPPDFVAKFKERKYIFMNKRTASSLGDEGVDEPEMSNKRKEARSKMNVLDKERLVWVDCEMTGLDIDTCHLIEVACLITDDQLNIIAEGPNIVIHQSDDVMDTMNEWCVKHHGESGLTEQVKDSKVSLRQAEMELLSFIRQHTPPSTCPLAGNSVHADKKFLDKYMPEFMKHLHYRIVDVSTIKELCRRWFPKDYENAPNKKMSHRALDDIKESIAELQYYRKTIFKT